MKTILKYALLGTAIYGAFKLGEMKGKGEVPVPKQLLPDPPEMEMDTVFDEETYVYMLINELKNKPNKSQKDKDNLSLLEIKLKQLINKK